MKNRNFYVPANSIIEFAEIIEENEMQGLIDGTTEDNELIISVDYEAGQSEAIIEMIEFIESIDVE